MIYLQILLLVIFLAFILIFTIRKKLLSFMNVGIRLLFLVFIIVGITAIFFQYPFNYLADQSLSAIGVEEQITKLDEQLPLQDLATETDELVDDLSSWLSWDDDDADADADADEAAEGDDIGYFERYIYEPIVVLIGFMYRLLALVISLLGSGALIYLTYGTSSMSDLRDLERRVAALEDTPQG